MRKRTTPIALVLALLAYAAASGPALAQENGGPIDIQLFRPAVDSKGYITLNASQPLGHLDLSFGLVVNWAYNVLQMHGAQGVDGAWCTEDGDAGTTTCDLASESTNPVVPSRYDIANLVTGHLQAALGLFKHFEVGIGFPVTIWTGNMDPNVDDTDSGDISAQGIGDLGFHLKGRILNTSKHPVGLGIVLSTYFPTGDPEKFMSSGGITIAPSVIVDREFLRGRVSLAVNIGARILAGSLRTDADGWQDMDRTCAPWDNPTADESTWKRCGTGEVIEKDHLLTYGIGAAFAVVPQRFSLVAEIIGQTGFSAFFDPDAFHSAHELLAGLKLYLGRNSFFSLGLGRGLRGQTNNHSYGSPDVRVFAAFIFEPSIGDRDGDGLKDDVDKCPDDPEDFDDFEDTDGCPDPDNDRDGLLDEEDKCPNEPEDKDGIEDDDGCPELDVLDRDGDNIPDEQDKCPDDPEDKDSFEDTDGCPDPDNDKDQILDVDDLCPNKPEDKDGFEDTDGCPDPDNDNDKILDVDDSCPNDPEIYNNFKDEDGCPDKGKVIERKGRIEILEKVQFETDKTDIKPESFALLDAVATTLRYRPEILLVEIQGHADERGSDDHNMELTDGRAKSVRQYLIDKGIDANRLQSKGYGETRPLDTASNEDAWSKNRRVEFVILKRAAQN